MSVLTDSTTRFTVAEYMKMARAGVFDLVGENRVELINGRIYRMSPQNDPHIVVMSNLIQAITPIVPKSDWVIFQSTVRLDKYSAPDPDMTWLPVAPRTPSVKWPTPILVIEASNTSYKRDSGVKLRKYAERKVPDYWIINIPADRIEVYRDPQNPFGQRSACFYKSAQNFTRGQSITVLERPNITLAVNDLLP
jgi:Uma2 family endonuclease